MANALPLVRQELVKRTFFYLLSLRIVVHWDVMEVTAVVDLEQTTDQDQPT